MRKLVLTVALMTLVMSSGIVAQDIDNAEVYMLTCAPGNESYSIYGHTAIRITFSDTGYDMVYNWGIFDFSTPNFVYRFAKGKLDYLLGAYSYERFLAEYVYEGRSVWSQKLNLTVADKARLFTLISENLRPENISYRYDFFHDNCASRVRDIIFAATGDSLVMPAQSSVKSFRQLVDPYQKVLPWLDLGADMLLGLPADRKASVTDEMFLPIYLRDNLAEIYLYRDGTLQPMAEPVITVVEMPPPPAGQPPWVPHAVLWLLFLAVALITLFITNRRVQTVTDIIIFTLYSAIALLLLFTNLISDHAALHFNLFLLGINILIPFVAVMLLAGKRITGLCRLAVIVSASWLPVSLIAGQGIHAALIPVVLIIMVRLCRHCSFRRAL